MEPRSITIVMASIPPEKEEEFNRWYNEEHVTGLLKVPGVLSARRYIEAPGQGDYGKLGIGELIKAPKYATLYEHANINVQNSEAFKKVRYSAWSDRIRPHMKNRMRNMYYQMIPEPK